VKGSWLKLTFRGDKCLAVIGNNIAS